MPIELTLDHTGPMTATAEDNALLLEAGRTRTGATRGNMAAPSGGVIARHWAGVQRG